MLHGVREGVVAFDPQGRVTVVNDEARRLLGLGTALGDWVADEDDGGELPRGLPGAAQRRLWGPYRADQH